MPHLAPLPWTAAAIHIIQQLMVSYSLTWLFFLPVMPKMVAFKYVHHRQRWSWNKTFFVVSKRKKKFSSVF